MDWRRSRLVRKRACSLMISSKSPRIYSPLVSSRSIGHHVSLPDMTPDQFWTSQDGQILTVKNKDDRTVNLILAFWPRHPAEFEFLKSNLAALKFTERSALA